MLPIAHYLFHTAYIALPIAHYTLPLAHYLLEVVARLGCLMQRQLQFLKLHLNKQSHCTTLMP